ncbi:hypothetical protein DES53_109100 [Roseimicrobium gellanilyticum]|uniref:Uncharacterized protein n=1 Tax=Roseimicrobium gellanilyticum TaxID=748857 RepID=A0A366HBF7_9BACT|nr:hypothetical protein [Roseimicrobium gellanilyticum]RBP39673.1 hypothetical protein DES53_109100 [Roseimicrobium gellanilyticum]
MPPPLENRILSLSWPQFVALVGALHLAATEFNENWSSADRTLKLKNQLVVATPGGVVNWDLVEQALNQLLGVTSGPAAAQVLLAENVQHVKGVLETLEGQGGGNAALVRTVRDQIEFIRAAKAIHALVQHQLAFKLTQYQIYAETKIENLRTWNAVRGTVRALRSDLNAVKDRALELALVNQLEMQRFNSEMDRELAKLETVLASPTVVELDLITPLDLTFKPYVAQVPSAMQRLMEEESTRIPWKNLAALSTTQANAGAAAAGVKSNEAFEAVQRLLADLVTQHGAWQALMNQVMQFVERMEAFLEGVARAVREVKSLAEKITILAAQVTGAPECAPQALLLKAAVDAVAVDEANVRNLKENLEGQINGAFNDVDNRLLDACGTLSNLL